MGVGLTNNNIHARLFLILGNDSRQPLPQRHRVLDRLLNHPTKMLLKLLGGIVEQRWNLNSKLAATQPGLEIHILILGTNLVSIILFSSDGIPDCCTGVTAAKDEKLLLLPIRRAMLAHKAQLVVLVHVSHCLVHSVPIIRVDRHVVGLTEELLLIIVLAHCCRSLLLSSIYWVIFKSIFFQTLK